jgi:hypothetical protein
MVFSTKPYDIPAINQDAIIAMGFDDEFYTASSPEEINQFYQKYCTVSNDDIPDADEVKVYDEAPAKKAAPVATENSDTPADIGDIGDIGDIDDLAKDPDDLPAVSAPAAPAAAEPKADDDIDAEKLLAGIDDL